MKRIRKSLKKRSGRTFLALVLTAALTVGGMTTAFATEEDTTTCETVTEETVDAMSDDDSVVISSDESGASAANIAAGDADDMANKTENDADTSIDDANGVALAPPPNYDPPYGLYGGYDGQNSMDDPDAAGACVGWDLSTMSAITGDSGLWWIDDYYVGESNPYDVEKTTDFSLKYQIEFHVSEDLAAGEVQIVIDASLGTYRNGNNIIPTELGIPYGTPDEYSETPSSPFNYYYIDKDGNILTESQAKTAEGAQVVVWNYRDIVSGSNAMFQVLYKNLDVMQIPDMTEWKLNVKAEVAIQTEDEEGNPATDTEIVNGNTLSGLVDTSATLTAVTKKAYTATDTSYTPELYTESQVNSYINGTVGEPYAGNFDDYIYIVWYVTLKGSATQSYEITIDESTFSDVTSNGSIVGYKVNTSSSATSSGVSYTYGTDGDGNPMLSFASSSQRSFYAGFYVVTAYDADTYVTNTELENDVTVTVHPVDGYDDDTTKSASATTTWGEYDWKYHGDVIGIRKYVGSTGTNTSKTYSAYETLYEYQKANGEDTGEFTFHTKSTNRGYSFTHNVDGTGVGEYIEGTYYTTTTVDDALYIYPNGGTTPSQMLTKEDYYFSSVKVVTTDNGYDIWEDTTAGAIASDTVDQDVYIYAMYDDADEEAADDDGWEYVGKVPFSTSGTMTYTFSADDLARQPYRVKAVHNTINYATYCTITLGVTLRGDSPTIGGILEEYGDDLTSLKIENLSGVAGQAYGQDARPETVYIYDYVKKEWVEYHDGDYYQDQSTDGSNYSEKDTVTGETLAEFTEGLYGTILMRDNSYSTLTQLEETSAASKSVTTENDTANARVLTNYYLTAYEAYYVTGSSTVDYLKDAGISMPARNEVSYYDLLPYGMQFNPNTTVVAGRITTMNSSGSWRTNERAWDTAGVTVEVNEEDVITNWNDTGRTMVIFHIYYDGDDASAFYDVPSSDQDLWYQGFGLYFQAYYDWADLDAVNAEYNIAAYIAENVTNETEQLLGRHDSTVYKDDGSANLTAQYEPFKGVSDLNDDGVTDLYTNMYASTSTSSNIAISSSDSIKKKVRADDDAVAEYGDTAFVGNGRGYTYEVTLTNSSGATLSGIVLYDRLEYSVEDGRADVENETNPNSVFSGLNPDDIENHWTGTFTGVALAALTDVGIDPVVYYNAYRDATISENGDESGIGKTTPADVLTEANGWYTEDRFIEVFGDLSEAKTIAINASKTTNGDDYILGMGDSLSFQIHMVAPEEVTEGYLYAFNNPSYYSVSTSLTGDVTSSTDIGDTVRVEIGEVGTLEVEKEFNNIDNVPASMQNAKFTFKITRNGEILAGQEYMVYTWDEDAEEWLSSDLISSTDAKGQFTLRAGQKAVFAKLVDVKDVSVTEVESMFWVADVEEDRSKVESDNELTYTFTNSYRSPVYLYKTAETTDLASDEELANAVFTFRLEGDTNGDGEYEPYVGDYIYVKEVLTDGSSPSIDTTKGDNGYGSTTDGYVTIKLGDIIAFFPCDEGGSYVNVPYRIVESETGGEWVCLDDGTASGKTNDYGTSETITNYYKYRNLILTKDLSDYDHDLDTCEDEWTFQVTHVTTDGDGNETTELVTGNHWYMIDADGNPVYDDNEEPMEGYLSEEGTFSFTGAGSGRRIVIEKLVEGEEYILAETNYDAELFEQVNDGTVDTTMPTYAITRSIMVTNKYLLKDLEVSKLVLSRDTVSAATHEFTFTLEKYENGEYVPAAGAVYIIDGVEYETNEDGTFTLKSNETAYFDDLGYQGDKYRITETLDEDFGQIYPTGNGSYMATLGSDDDFVRFINGDFDDVVSITKELNGLDKAGEAYVDIVEENNQKDTIAGEGGDAPYTVDVMFGVYDGDTLVTSSAGALIDYTDGNSEYPFVYIKISADGSYELKSYNGGEMKESLAPYEYIYIAELGSYTVKASEDSDMERIILDVTSEVAGEIGSDEILSEGDVMSGSAAANEDIVLVNNISSAHKESEIYKLMTEDSDEVLAGSQITFVVQIYDAESGTWSPASGIKYIMIDGCTGVTRDSEGALASHDTEDAEPTSGVLTTGADGKITLAKTEKGYPYIRFTEDEVYANVYEAMEGEEGIEDGTLRIIESESGTDEEWGHLVGYDGEGWVGGPAYNIPYADTFYNGNDDTLVFEVEKEMTDGSECDDDFTFYLKQILSASTSPITSMDQILDSEVGAGVTYVIYDVEIGEKVGEGVTDENGSFTLKAGQYAKFYVPEDTTWYVYEGVNLGYPLYSAEANDDEENPDEKWGYADNASIVDDVNGVVQNEHSVYQKEEPVVKYAVKVWGINQDTYSDDGGETFKNAGLTFGPAIGAEHLDNYVSRETVGEEKHPSKYCIHDMTWDEIIEQSATDPTVFADCKANGCTKAVELTPNETLFNMETVDNYMDQDYDGDGVSTLYYLLNGTGSSPYTYGAIWNYSYTGNSSSDPANIYSRSRIRTTLTGDKSNIDEWLTDNPSANDYYGYDTLCDTSTCLLSCFPSNLQEAMVPRTTLNSGNATSGSYRNADTKTTYDKLFLFSLKEIGISSSSYDDAGGVDYGVNPNSSDRVAYEFSGTGATASSSRTWWSRSRNSNYNYNASYVYTSGSYSYNGVTYGSGLSPGFCLPGPEEPEPTVNYAVKVWGICVDTYSYDEGVTTDTASLTFGPATGANHLEDYVECDSDTCIHKLSWDEIIAYCNEYQGNGTKLTELFGSCLTNGCTKAVGITPNETLFDMDTVENYMDQGYSGDGVSTLHYLLNGTGSTDRTHGAIWNCSYTAYTSSDPANIYSRSRIRATLIGDSADAKAQVQAGGNDYYGVDTMCDATNCLFSCFPANLRKAMVPRTTLNSGNATSGSCMNADTKNTHDKLFLFSLGEIGIPFDWDDAGGDDYGVNPNPSDRVAYEFSGTDATTSSSLSWWLRSRNSDNYYIAYYVYTNGTHNTYIVPSNSGLSPGFCIK